MENKEKKAISRRRVLGLMGAGAAAAGAMTMTGCGNKQNAMYDPAGHHSTPVPGADQMTYRSWPNLDHDRISLLGYGCMRWPMINDADGRPQAVDQERVNELIDYAMAHGVNYYDTSPAYCMGLSEKATGDALKKYPRESYYIATKLSNFDPRTHSYEGSKLMYENSFKELSTDYIDYYLLHVMGQGGLAMSKRRFFENGMYDFLLKEKEAGRIRHLGYSFHGDQETFDWTMEEHDKGNFHWDFVQIQMNYLDWHHAVGASMTAEYMYTELTKRDIPVVIMEPLLGGRLANIPNHLVARLKLRTVWLRGLSVSVAHIPMCIVL